MKNKAGLCVSVGKDNISSVKEAQKGCCPFAI